MIKLLRKNKLAVVCDFSASVIMIISEQSVPSRDTETLWEAARAAWLTYDLANQKISIMQRFDTALHRGCSIPGSGVEL